MPATVQRVSAIVGGYQPQRKSLSERMRQIKKLKTTYKPKLQAASVFAAEEKELALKFRDRYNDLNLKQIQECISDYRHYANVLSRSAKDDFDYKAIERCVKQAVSNVYKAGRSIPTLTKSEALIMDEVEKHEEKTDKLIDRFNKDLKEGMVNRLSKGEKVRKSMFNEEGARKALNELEETRNKTLTMLNTDYDKELKNYLDQCIEILENEGGYNTNSLRIRIDTEQRKYTSRLEKLAQKQEKAITEGYVRLDTYIEGIKASKKLEEAQREIKVQLTKLAKEINADIKDLNTKIPTSKRDIIIMNYEINVDDELKKADEIRESLKKIQGNPAVKIRKGIIDGWKSSLREKREKLEANKKYCHKIYSTQETEEKNFNNEILQKINKLKDDREKALSIGDEPRQVIAMEQIIQKAKGIKEEIDKKRFLIYTKDEMYNELETLNAGTTEGIKDIKRAQKEILAKRKNFIEKENSLRVKIQAESMMNENSINKYSANIDAYKAYEAEALVSTVDSIREEIGVWTTRLRKYRWENLLYRSREAVNKVNTEQGSNIEPKIKELSRVREELQGYAAENKDLFIEGDASKRYTALIEKIDKKINILQEKALSTSDIAQLRQKYISTENRLRQKIKTEKAKNRETLDQYRLNIEEYKQYREQTIPTIKESVSKDLEIWWKRYKDLERVNVFVTCRDALEKIKPEKGENQGAKLEKVRDLRKYLQGYERKNPEQFKDQNVEYQARKLYGYMDKAEGILSGISEAKAEEQRVRDLKKLGIRNGVYVDNLVKGQVYLSESGHARNKGYKDNKHVFELVTPTGDGTYKTYNRDIRVNGATLASHISRNIEIGKEYLYKGGPGTARYMVDLGGGKLGFEVCGNSKTIKGTLTATDIINGIIEIPDSKIKQTARNFNVPYTKNPEAMRANANMIKRNGQGYCYLTRFGFVTYAGYQQGAGYVFTDSQNQQFVVKQNGITKGDIQLAPVKGNIYNVRGKISLCRGLDSMGFYNFIPFEDMEKGKNKGMQIQYKNIHSGEVQELTQSQTTTLTKIMQTDKEMLKIFESYYNAIM